MIVGALLGGLVLSVLARVGTPGTATRAPLPQLPATGACIRLYTPVQQLVPCSDPHDGEVTGVWRAGVGTELDRASGCGAATAAYLGAAPDPTSWHPPPVRQIIRVITGPDRRVLPNWSWQACLLVPELPTSPGTGFSGTLAASAGRPGPVELRSCYQIPDPAGGAAASASGPRPASIRTVSCRTAHDGEVLAVRRVRMAGRPRSASISASWTAIPGGRPNVRDRLRPRPALPIRVSAGDCGSRSG